ncbi:hypothetical protein HHI36_000157 [Cryptolaemus montrouzieri]|uniref:Uncharacterized protein n=1 Tax=Cryptolaemus montrouzieri TaxID=559131 RepID=A0ABD2P3T1_9CUCU
MLLGMINNKSLKVLNIAANKIGCLGLRMIAKWLETEPALLGLHVGNNQIGDTGARVFSFGMCYSKLKFLNISYDRIEDDGMACILDTLKKPYNMGLFFFYGNPIVSKSLKMVERMILSGVLKQNYIDTKVNEQYYSVMTYGYTVPLKIKQSKVESQDPKRRPFYHLPYYERYQPFY